MVPSDAVFPSLEFIFRKRIASFVTNFSNTLVTASSHLHPALLVDGPAKLVAVGGRRKESREYRTIIVLANSEEVARIKFC